MVERTILKWSYRIKLPEELFSCYIFCNRLNISVNGDVAIAVIGNLMMINNDGKITWREYCDGGIDDLQLSDDGHIIVVERGRNTLVAYDKRGKLLWTYSVVKEQVIRDYKLSHDGRYTIVAIDSEKDNHELILLKDGNVEWVKSGRGRVMSVAISPNNAYIASASYDDYIRVTLYTVNGVKLWGNAVVEFPHGIDIPYPFYDVDVSEKGEVLLTEYRTFFIANGRILWDSNYRHARFTRDGNRIIAVKDRGCHRGFGVIVLNREGELLWEYCGAYRYVISDEYYLLFDENNYEIVLVSAGGKVLQRITLSKLGKKLDIGDVCIRISPNGKYFTVSVKDDSEKACYLYFFENRDPLIRDIKEILLKEINELLKK